MYSQRWLSTDMPPKKGRQELARQAARQVLTPDIIAKRTKRHLEELERSNYAEPSILTGLGEEDEEGGNKYSKGRARQAISDKRQLGNIPGNSAAAGKKKSTMNVRTALLYRKNLATLIEESHISSLPSAVPTYLTAGAPPSNYPPRSLCTICGYWGRYKCKRCAMAYCDLNCESIHLETRCERRVI